MGIVKYEEVIYDDKDDIQFQDDLILNSYEYNGYDTYDASDRFSLSDNVVSHEGNYLSGVTVRITGDDSSYTIQTDEDGYFSLGDLIPGQYRLNVSCPGKRIVPEEASCIIMNTDIYVGTFIALKDNAMPLTTEYSPQEYFNLKKGAEWIYTRTECDEDMNYETSVEEHVCRGEEINEDNGKTYYLIEHTYQYEMPRRYRFEGNDIFQYDMLAWLYAILPLWKETGNSDIVDSPDFLNSFYQDILSYRFNRQAGYTWELLSTGTVQDSAYANACIYASYVGLEDVEVSSGTLHKCAKFELVSMTRFDAYNHKGGDMYYLSNNITLITTRWFAPNIGLVRETREVLYGCDKQQEDRSWVYEPGTFMLESELILKEYHPPE